MTKGNEETSTCSGHKPGVVYTAAENGDGVFHPVNQRTVLHCDTCSVLESKTLCNSFLVIIITK
jgi:hypothetical protein